ncbi:MAG: glutathione S-transferase family protein [Proteobacteria bacterium]|nr:MAG: glutathione S-transferase family protein [Pseudomonadota bacterium]
MGVMVDGEWHDAWYDTEATDGRFIRAQAQFRNWITANGSPGPSGEGGFTAAADRYHLYIGNACPWAHRTAIFRTLKGLAEMIPMSVVHWHMAAGGWTFAAGDGVVPDPIHNAEFTHEIYRAADPKYSGRVTIPILWDKKNNTIVSNESSEIIRMFNCAFDNLGASPGDYYPQALRDDIDSINARVYDTLNNGVYKCGFATSQAAYDEAITPLFETLDWLENMLSDRTYLLGDTITEADWRLFTTLIRFDPVYVGHFKCNIRRLVDYPNLSRLTQMLYTHPGVAATINMSHIKNHYYGSHESINPSRVVPAGPASHIGAE